MRRLIILSMLMFCGLAQADQTLQLPPFNAIKSDGVLNIDITVGGAQSVVLKAPDSDVSRYTFTVVDGELEISSPHKHHNVEFDSDNRVAIAIPSLRLFKGKGVGEVIISNISGDRVDLSYEGVGNLEASGKVKWLRLKGHGVGSIDTKKLIAENADVDFDGVGEVDVYVSNHMNAVVHGVGSLTYYGNPKSITKSADGLGAISPGNSD